MACKKRITVRFLAILLMSVLSFFAFAQQPHRDEIFSEAELDQMLAPIALYPDALLSQILMASTYPLEMVEAARWSADNSGYDGTDAVDAVEGKNWDPSIKALVAFPQVLARMDENLQWSRQLGDAYLMQEGDVIDSIQRLRESAEASGYLDSMEHVRAYRDQDLIIIEPHSLHVVYVPHYYPLTVYNDWWWPNYQPYYWGSPRGFHSGMDIYWGHGIRIKPFFFFSTFDWGRRHIVIVDSYRYRSHVTAGPHRTRFKKSHRWQHDPKHRRGVRYRHHLQSKKYRRYAASQQSFGRPHHWKVPRRERLSDDNMHSGKDRGRDPINHGFNRQQVTGQERALAASLTAKNKSLKRENITRKFSRLNGVQSEKRSEKSARNRPQIPTSALRQANYKRPVTAAPRPTDRSTVGQALKRRRNTNSDQNKANGARYNSKTVIGAPLARQPGHARVPKRVSRAKPVSSSRYRGEASRGQRRSSRAR